ncbi:MAG: hypothetical protein LQ348_005498 [Seirophora lacunosa]|nr:MAG: hypothetical protein LQ348_005498 [Seirophora lacunosa]
MSSMSSTLPPVLDVPAKPYDYTFPPLKTALLVIDMQRDFLLEGGFGHIEGGFLDAVQASVAPTERLLTTFRQAGLAIFHTREGHKPDLSDCPSSKLNRQAAAPNNTQHSKVIGDGADMGRLLVRGEYGHDIVDTLQPWPNEVVIDKPGRGAFWNTTLLDKLKARAITHLIVSGAVEEATAGYDEEFKSCTLQMIYWSQGLFGFVANLEPLLRCFAPYISAPGASWINAPPQTPPTFDGDLTISGLQQAYRGGLSPVTVIEAVLNRIEEFSEIDPAVWIYREPRQAVLDRIRRLQIQWPKVLGRPPLFGVPFSVKDSIDIAGLPTTTACPPLARVPSESAPSYEILLSQGAIFVGKTNLDQLATGMTGCRSPYGIPRCVFNRNYISGGSSSGSCVSVGAKLVSFSLATDTAGSGRIPSGFNGVVGYKPTRGLISARGVTPACLSLDCIAIVASNVSDARTVWDLTVRFDEDDRYAKTCAPIPRHINSTGPQAVSFNFGIPPPDALQVCSPIYRRKFDDVVKKLQKLGGQLQPIEWKPFENAGKLLYEGSFVSERLANLPDSWLEQNRTHLHPVIESIFSAVVARNSTAVDAYRDLQAKALFTRQAEKVFEYSAAGVDVVVVPSAPRHWTVKEVLAEPVSTNSLLGEFAHCGNVLDLCAVAVPAGTYPVEEVQGAADGANGQLPFSVTFLGRSMMDAETLDIADRFDQATKNNM